MNYDNSTALSELKGECEKRAHNAYTWIFSSYSGRLFSYGINLVKSDKVSEDIVHNVFEKLWEKRIQTDIAGSLQTYLYNSMRNSCFDYLARANMKREHYDRILNNAREEDDFNSLCPEFMLEEKERKAALRKAIETLPNKCKKIFLLWLDERLKYHEIAERLGVTTGTVKTQMSRASEKLQALLDGEI